MDSVLIFLPIFVAFLTGTHAIVLSHTTVLKGHDRVLAHTTVFKGHDNASDPLLANKTPVKSRTETPGGSEAKTPNSTRLGALPFGSQDLPSAGAGQVHSEELLPRSSNPSAEQPAVPYRSSNLGEQQSGFSQLSQPNTQQHDVFQGFSIPREQQPSGQVASSYPDRALHNGTLNPEVQNRGVLAQSSSIGMQPVIHSASSGQQQAWLPTSSNPWVQTAALSDSSNPGAHKQAPALGISNPGSSSVQHRSVLSPLSNAQRQSIYPSNPRIMQAGAGTRARAAAITAKAVANLPQYPQLPAGQRIFKYVNLTLKSFLGFALVSWDVEDSYLLTIINCTLITEYIGVGDCAPANPAQAQKKEIPLDQKIRSYELENVDPWRTLAVTLKGETATNKVDHMTSTVTTHEGKPVGSVGNIRTVSLQPESAQLAWDPPPCEERGGLLKHYTIELWPTAARQRSIPLTSTSESLYIKNLQPYTEYNVEIAYVNSVGSGPVSLPYTFQTSQGPPSPPLVYNFTYDDLTIGVVIVQPLQPHGLVEEYHVQLTGGPSGLSNLYTPLNGTEYIIGKLQPNTTYSIKARARNAAGWGDWSHTIYVTTKEEARPIPQAVKQSLSNATCIGFYWVPPVTDVNVVSSYKITVSTNDQSRKFESSVDKSTNSFIQCGLTPYTLYSVTVSVMKDSGRLGQPLGARMWTEGMPPPKPRQPIVRKVTSSTITVELHPVRNDYGPITSYEIRLLELHHNHSKHIGHDLMPFSDPELQDKGVAFDAPQFHSPAGPTIGPASSTRNAAEQDYTRKNGPDIRPVGKRSTRVRSKLRHISNGEQLTAKEPPNNYRLLLIALPDSVAIHGHNSTQIESWIVQYLRQQRFTLPDHNVAGWRPPLNNPDVNRDGSDVFNKTGSDLSYSNGSKSSVLGSITITRAQKNGTYLQKVKDYPQFDQNSSVIKDSPLADGGKGDSGELVGVANRNARVRAAARGLAGQSSGRKHHAVAGRARRALGNPPGVLWLELPASDVYEPTIITIGDDKMYYGRRNLPLKPDTEYAVVYVVKSTVVDVTKHAFAYSKSSVYTLEEQKEEDDDSDVWLIILIILAVILLALFFLLGFFVIRHLITRGRQKGQGSDEDGQLSDYEDTDEERDEDDVDNYQKPLQVKDGTDFGQTPMKNTSDLESFFNPIHSLGQPRYISSMRDNVMYNNNVMHNNNAYPPYASRHSSGDATTDPRNNDGNNSAMRASSTSTSQRTWSTTTDPRNNDGNNSAMRVSSTTTSQRTWSTSNSDPEISFGSAAFADSSTSFTADRRCGRHCCCNYPCGIVSSDSNASSITCDNCSSVAGEELLECDTCSSIDAEELPESDIGSSIAVEELPECDICSSIAVEELPESTGEASTELRAPGCRSTGQACVGAEVIQYVDPKSTNSSSKMDVSSQQPEGSSGDIGDPSDTTASLSLCSVSESMSSNNFGGGSQTSLQIPRGPSATPLGDFIAVQIAFTGSTFSLRAFSRTGQSYECESYELEPNRVNDPADVSFNRNNSNVFEEEDVACAVCQGAAAGTSGGCRMDIFSLGSACDNSLHNDYTTASDLADSSHASYSQTSTLPDSSHASYSQASTLPNSSHASYSQASTLPDSSHAIYSQASILPDSSHAIYSPASTLPDSSHASCSLVPKQSDLSHASCSLVPNQSDLSHASCSQVYIKPEKPNSHPTIDVYNWTKPHGDLQNETSICLDPKSTTVNTHIKDGRLGMRQYPANWKKSSMSGIFQFRICQQQTGSTTMLYNEKSNLTTNSLTSINVGHERRRFDNSSISDAFSQNISTAIVYKTNIAVRQDCCNQRHTRYSNIDDDNVEDARYTNIGDDIIKVTRYTTIDDDDIKVTRYTNSDDDVVEVTRYTNSDDDVAEVTSYTNIDDDVAEVTRYTNIDDDDVEDTRTTKRDVRMTDADESYCKWMHVCEDFNNNSSNNKSGNSCIRDNMMTYCNFDDDDDDIEDIVLDGNISVDKIDDEEEENDDSKEERDIAKKNKHANVGNEVALVSQDDSEDDISSVYINEKNANSGSSDEEEEEENTTKDGDNDGISTPLQGANNCENLIESRVGCLREGKPILSEETMGIMTGHQDMFSAKSNVVSSLPRAMPITAGGRCSPSDTITKVWENGVYNIQNGVYNTHNGVYNTHNGVYNTHNGVYTIQNEDRSQTRTSTDQGVPVTFATNYSDLGEVHERRLSEVRVRQQALEHGDSLLRPGHDRPGADSIAKSRKLPGRKSVKFMFWCGDRTNEKSTKDKSLSTRNTQLNTTNITKKVPLETKTHNFSRRVSDRACASHGLKKSDVVCKETHETISTSGSVYESSSSAGLLQEGQKDIDRGPDKHIGGNGRSGSAGRNSSVKKRWFHVFHPKKNATKEEVNQIDACDNNVSGMNIDARNGEVSFQDAKKVNGSMADTDISDGKLNWLRENETPEKEKHSNKKRIKIKNIFSVFVKDNDENENKPREGRMSFESQSGGRDRSSRGVDNGSRLSRRPRAAGLRPTARSRRSGHALSFKDEFKALERYRHHVMRSMSFDTALRHPDRNRFSHTLPPEHTRVNVEITRPGEPDYYNASYMDLKSDIRYIVAQSPFSPATVSDFWRLVLQNGVQTIVMMSRCVEWGVFKCVQYWADSGIFADGPVIVQTVGHQQYADVAIRTLKVSSSSSPEVTVTHFQFQTWPASDVPDDPVPLLDLRYRVRRSHGSQETPILVHCDSGSAQSAVFIAVDLLIEQYGRDGSVNVYGFVKKMRKSRPSMIRSLRQYRFIYECLFEEFQAGDTVLRLDMADKYRALSARNPQTGVSYLMDEFRMLSAFTPDLHPGACAAGLLPENALKNVDQNIVPPDFYRPYLNVRGNPAIDGYVNAVFVDGLQRHHEFLVTQTPLNSTVYAFWRMVYDYQVQTIVQLGPFSGHSQAQYIPMTGSRRFEYLLVELVNVGLQRSITVRNLKLCADTMAGLENRAVRHFQLAHWQDDSAAASRNNSSSNSHTEIIDLLELVMTWQTAANRRTRPIVVCCTNGATICGVFCCCAVLCERLREDKEVDLYHTVKHIKRRRPQFIADFDQYQFLHLVLLEYIDTVLNNEGDVMDGGEDIVSSSEESDSGNGIQDSAAQTEPDCAPRGFRDASCEPPHVLNCHDARELKPPRFASTEAGCRQKCQSAGVLGRSHGPQAGGAAGASACGCEETYVRKVVTCEDDDAVNDCWCSSAPVSHERRPPTYQRRQQWRESQRYETTREVCSPPTAHAQPSRPRYRTRQPVGQDRMEPLKACADITMRVADCSPCAAQRDSSVRFQPSVSRPQVLAEGRPCTETLVERCYLSPARPETAASPCRQVRPRSVSSPSPVNYFDESSSSSEFDVSLNLV